MKKIYLKISLIAIIVISMTAAFIVDIYINDVNKQILFDSTIFLFLIGCSLLIYYLLSIERENSQKKWMEQIEKKFLEKRFEKNIQVDINDLITARRFKLFNKEVKPETIECYVKYLLEKYLLPIEQEGEKNMTVTEFLALPQIPKIENLAPNSSVEAEMKRFKNHAYVGARFRPQAGRDNYEPGSVVGYYEIIAMSDNPPRFEYMLKFETLVK